MTTIALPERPIRRIRRDNLKRLIAEAGGTARHLATEVQSKFPGDKSLLDKHLSTIVSGSRNLGDELAAKLEAAMGKPFGWMDQADAQDKRA